MGITSLFIRIVKRAAASRRLDSKNDQNFLDTRKQENKKMMEKPNDEETNYLSLVDKIIKTGSNRMDRTNVGTLSVFGTASVYNLADNRLPLLTTKPMFFRGIVEELLWFIRGSTNAKELQERNIHIWDGNSSRSYLDSLGFYNRQEGDIGPGYGFQWRHSGATYKTCMDDYTGQGIDQLSKLIEEIRKNPNSRRLILSAWNPVDVSQMCLPPCHCLAQFYVDGNKLSCQMYQRSADMGLGVPFNIASYALLTHLIAHVTHLKPWEFIHVTGDTHVYLNHVEPLKQQLQRTPRPFPTLTITSAADTPLEKFSFKDFQLNDYNPYLEQIKLKMAI